MKRISILILTFTLLFTVTSSALAVGESINLDKPRKTKVVTYQINENHSNLMFEEKQDEHKSTEKQDAKLLPNHILYPLKRAYEQMKISLASSKEKQVEFLLESSNARILEAETLQKHNEMLFEEVMVDYLNTMKEVNGILNELSEKEAKLEVYDKVAKIQGKADKLIKKAKRDFSDKLIKKLKASNFEEIKKTIAINIYTMTKQNFTNAKKTWLNTMEDYYEAKSLDNTAAASQLLDKLKRAEEQKEDLLEIKVEMEIAKNELFPQKKE